MLKFLPIVVVVALMISGLVFLRLRQVGETDVKKTPVASQGASLLVTNVSLEQRVKTLEDSIILIAQRIGGSTSQQILDKTTTSTSSDFKIKALEENIVSLQKQIDALKQTSSTPALSTGKNVIYIPFGSGGSTTDSNWVTFDTYQVSLDPADFPGYSGMQLEVTGKLIQAVGSGYARLYNSTDSQAITSSDVSTASDTYQVVSSTGFKLPSGRKTYQLQVKTDKNFEFYLQTARIKVSF